MCVDVPCENCIVRNDGLRLKCSECAEGSSKLFPRQNRQHSSAISHISNSSPPTRKRSIDGGYTSGTDSANTSEIVIKKRLTFSKKSHSTSEIETWNAHLQVDYHLETVTPSCSTVYQKITSETLIEIMQKLSQIEFMQKYILIDCRYDYEYNGGHIKGAQSLFNPETAADFFFNKDGSKKINRIPIFYCEYSQKRGPTMANNLREVDRKLNSNIYPRCDYEEIYLLEGGYKNFYAFTRGLEKEQRVQLCEPDNYVIMFDDRYKAELRKHQFHKKNVSKPMKKWSSTTSVISILTTSGTRISTLRQTCDPIHEHDAH